MATDFYVVKHHGAWRIRVDGKHHGDFASRVAAVDAAKTEAHAVGLGAKVFSTGVITQFHYECEAQGAL